MAWNVIKMVCLNCNIERNKYGCCNNPNCRYFELVERKYRPLNKIKSEEVR